MAYAVRLDSLKTQRLAAGYSVTRLAQLSATSDRLIVTLEAGGSCTEMDASKLADALGVTTTTLGRAPLSP